jgi:hypothetical protein
MSKLQTRVLKEKITDTIDYTTGEETSSSKMREILHSTEPDFIKVYLDCISGFAEYPKSLNPILLSFLKRMTYADEQGGQIICVNLFIKEAIAKECSVSVKRVEQALTEFVKAKCFLRVAWGTYSVNAKFFGRGNWRDIEKLREIQAEFTLSRDGRKEFTARFYK